jgi:prolyl oligopeptidase
MTAVGLVFAASPAFAVTFEAQAQAGAARAPVAAPLAYPETRSDTVIDEQFGVKVADPYRWLETDVRNDAQVRDWVTAQNKVTDAFLAGLPEREAFKTRITQLYDYERFGLPDGKGG